MDFKYLPFQNANISMDEWLILWLFRNIVQSLICPQTPSRISGSCDYCETKRLQKIKSTWGGKHKIKYTDDVL